MASFEGTPAAYNIAWRVGSVAGRLSSPEEAYLSSWEVVAGSQSR
jgi:hypothetical protein